MSRLHRRRAGAHPLGKPRPGTSAPTYAGPHDTADTSEFTGRRERYKGQCPRCGGVDKLTVKRRHEPYAPPYGVHCWNADCSALGSEYPGELARYVGAPSGWEILQNAPFWLAPYLGEPTTVNSKPATPPSEGEVRRRHKFLRASPKALRYLRRERGLSTSVVKEFSIGYDGQAFWLPIRAEGRLVQLKTRYWPTVPPGRGKYKFLPGCAAYVWPPLPAAGPLILVAGEFDALCLRSHGLPGISLTTGCTTGWRSEWSANWRNPITHGSRGYSCASA
jgi:hypothetical protein